MKQRLRGMGRIFKQKKCKTWSISYYHLGKRIRESTGSTSQADAERKLKRRIGELATGMFAGPALERIRVAELWEPFIREQSVNGRKGVKNTTIRWVKHLEPFFGARRVASIGTDSLNQYVDERMKEGAKNATINREIAVLRRMFRLGHYAKPQKVLMLPKFPRLQEKNVRTGFLEPAKYDALVAAAGDRLWLRAILEIYAVYGWRKREVLAMRVRQVDFKADVIRLDVGTTKNKEGREVAMTAKVRTLLSECARNKQPDDFLFTRKGKPVKEFRKMWESLCVAAGVGKMICAACGEVVTKSKCKCGSKQRRYVGLIVHDLRRTAARNLRRAGVAEGVIMRVGGWKTRSVFERYNIVDQRDVREALTKLEQLQSRETQLGHDSAMIAQKTVQTSKSKAVN